MPEEMSHRELADEIWYWYLTGRNRVGFPNYYQRALKGYQALNDRLPGKPRCIECHVPMGGLGAWVMRAFGFRPSVLTPRLCNKCEQMILETEGGADVELSLLFADIRGSTAIAGQKAVAEYTVFIQRFYKAAAAGTYRAQRAGEPAHGRPGDRAFHPALCR